jgi:hypothetical protein
MTEIASATAEFKNVVLRNTIPVEEVQTGFKIANAMTSGVITIYQTLVRAQIEMDGFVSKIYRYALKKNNTQTQPSA